VEQSFETMWRNSAAHRLIREWGNECGAVVSKEDVTGACNGILRGHRLDQRLDEPDSKLGQ
jgi:hypothetical protein